MRPQDLPDPGVGAWHEPGLGAYGGMEVVVVGVPENGDIDLADFAAKAEAAGDRLAAAMITYPSTHGVFEETVREVCRITHEHGGQVYLDGANLNAMVGLSRPGDLGADVSHLNLHKTFCIPHGGGGPGMGPIGVKAHLAPHLPGHPGDGRAERSGVGRALWLGLDPADLLRLCAPDGGRGADAGDQGRDPERQLPRGAAEGAYDVLFTGAKGRVAHECILDTRPFAEAGVTVDDIAKRLMDHGFHAPTMSWPVAGTLMIEPTESEPKAELDRFVTAMLAIRAEIAEVEAGKIDVERAPCALRRTRWRTSCATGTVPTAGRRGVFRPAPSGSTSTGRRSTAWTTPMATGNLVCTCPPLEEYLDAASSAQRERPNRW
jgi:glycine dehydrogenase